MKRLRVMRKMSGKGDEQVAEWNETATPEDLEKIEKEFNELTSKGFFAADIEKGELIDKFDPNANILMIPRMQGGLA